MKLKEQLSIIKQDIDSLNGSIDPRAVLIIKQMETVINDLLTERRELKEELEKVQGEVKSLLDDDRENINFLT